MTERRSANGDKSSAERSEWAERAGQAGDRVSNLEDATKLTAIVHPSDASRAAARIGERVLGPASAALGLTEAQLNYMADLKRMSPDEAFVNSYGKKGLRLTGAGLGGALGAAGGGVVGGSATVGIGAPAGAVIGGVAGARVGEEIAAPAADALLPAYRAGKRAMKKTAQDLRNWAQIVSVYNTPAYWLDRRGPRGVNVPML